jgi:hypothetical protein
VSPRGGGREKDEINGYIRLSRLRYPPRTLRVSEPRQLAGEGGREGGSSREGESDGGRERARQREEKERVKGSETMLARNKRHIPKWVVLIADAAAVKL